MIQFIHVEITCNILSLIDCAMLRLAMHLTEVKKLYSIALLDDSLSVSYVTPDNYKLYVGKDVAEIKGDVGGF